MQNRRPIKRRLTRTANFLKTTAIGGLIFLLPVGAIGWLLGSVYQIVLVIYEPLKEGLLAYSPNWISSPSWIALLFLLSVAILLALCFVCGLAAKRAIGRKFSQTIEKQLIMVFPKYAIYKDIVAGNLGGDETTPSLSPVVVRLDDKIQIGYEAGRTEQNLSIVYLPGAPDPWIGSVALVESERVERLDVDFNETAAICERLGRDSQQLLATIRRKASPS